MRSTLTRTPRLAATALAAFLSALAGPLAATAPTLAPQGSIPAPAGDTKLVAFLAMNSGFGPADHDGYERRIAPIAASHGMLREGAFTLEKFLGGSGPAKASTFGVWSLETPASLPAVMSDAGYAAEVPLRDRLHDMQASKMYLVKEEYVASTPAKGGVVLVGIIAMNPGFDFADHASYEKTLEAITSRHGMKLIKAYRVLKQLGPGSESSLSVNIWSLTSPESLGKVMQDPDYQALVPYRDRIHNMAETSMYFAIPRKEAQ
jgi:hypothetical protein